MSAESIIKSSEIFLERAEKLDYWAHLNKVSAEWQASIGKSSNYDLFMSISREFATAAKVLQDFVWHHDLRIAFLSENHNLGLDSNKKELSDEEVDKVIRSEIMNYYLASKL